MFEAPWMAIYVAVGFCLHPAIGARAFGGSVVLSMLAVWTSGHARLPQRALEANAESSAAQEAVGGSADVVRALGMTQVFVVQFETAGAQANLPQMEAAQVQEPHRG